MKPPEKRFDRHVTARWACLGLALLIGLALRGAAAWNQSLIVDEFHSHFHATQPSLAVFFQTLLSDNHPPLSFLLFRCSFALLGEGAFAMRLLAIFFGACGIVATARLARRLPSRVAQFAAPCLLAVSSLHLDVTSDVRMYALHTLCVVGLIQSLIEVLESQRGRWRVALWLWIGLHTHYYFLHYAFLLAVTVFGLSTLAPRYRRVRRDLAAPLAAVFAASLPWFGYGFWRQLQHGELPGGRTISLARWAESLAHQLYLNLSLGGDAWRPIYLAGSALALILGGLGFLALVRRGIGEGEYAMPTLLAVAAFGVPTWAGIIAWIHVRAGFNWNYLSASAAPLCVLIAAAWNARSAFGKIRAAGIVFVLVSALHLSWKNAFWVGPENYREAVDTIVRSAQPTDAVISAEIQPNLFPLGLAWRYYAPRLAQERSRSLPTRIELGPDRGIPDVAVLDEHERLFLLDRTLPPKTPLFDQLERHYETHRVQGELGWGIRVHTFE